MRSALAVATATLVLALGAGACGDDDEDGFPAALAEEVRHREADSPDRGPCRHLAPADLEAALGVRFEPGVAGPGSCTYRGAGGPAAVTVNVAELPADAELALETTTATCDPGSATALVVEGATGAFACRLSDVAVVGGTSATAYAVVLGSLGPEADPAALQAPLAGLLARVLAGEDRGDA